MNEPVSEDAPAGLLSRLVVVKGAGHRGVGRLMRILDAAADAADEGTSGIALGPSAIVFFYDEGALATVPLDAVRAAPPGVWSKTEEPSND